MFRCLIIYFENIGMITKRQTENIISECWSENVWIPHNQSSIISPSSIFATFGDFSLFREFFTLRGREITGDIPEKKRVFFTIFWGIFVIRGKTGIYDNFRGFFKSILRQTYPKIPSHALLTAYGSNLVKIHLLLGRVFLNKIR